MTHMTQKDPNTPDEAPGVPLGTVRVDARGRVYFKRLSGAIEPGALFMVDADSVEDPKTIRMRLVEGS